MGGHESDLEKPCQFSRDKKVFERGKPFSFSLKHCCDTKLQLNLVSFFPFTSPRKKKEAEQHMIYVWEHIYKDKQQTNYRPQLGWLLKTKMHLACIWLLTKCDSYLETWIGCLQTSSRRKQAPEFDFSLLFSRFLMNKKSTFSKSLACATSFRWVVGNGDLQVQRLPSLLHCILEEETEQRKPDLRVEFLALIFTMRMQKLACL